MGVLNTTPIPVVLWCGAAFAQDHEPCTEFAASQERGLVELLCLNFP